MMPLLELVGRRRRHVDFQSVNVPYFDLMFEEFKIMFDSGNRVESLLDVFE